MTKAIPEYDSKQEIYTQKNPKIVKLSETINMLRKIAEIEIDQHGFYTCVIDGIQTKIIK